MKRKHPRWAQRATPAGGAYYVLRLNGQTLATVDWSRTTGWYWHGFGVTSLNGTKSNWSTPTSAKQACKKWYHDHIDLIDENGMADACRNDTANGALHATHKAIAFAFERASLAALVDERCIDAMHLVRDALRHIEKFIPDELKLEK
jgi:hypothetical protein